ncbi:TnsA endonuclease N-terminal domain-containing protein [Streptomyces sp. NPDC002851]
MLDGTPESRHGRGWSEAEDAALVDGVREGLDQQQLADRHGRSPASIRYRLEQFVLPAAADDNDPLEWLRVRLADDPTYAWRNVRDERLHERHQRRRHNRWRTSSTSPTAAAVDEVLNDWQKTTGHTLGPERREAFRTRHAAQDLAAVAAPVRRATAERLWQKDARLLLDDWLLESLCPGASDLPADWSAFTEHDANTVLILRELVAAAVAEIPSERHREVMSRRLGQHDQPAQTLRQVGEALGRTGERARQLQERALRYMARSRAPASRRLRTLLAELSGIEVTPSDTEPSSGEHLFDLAEILLPALDPRYAVPLLARLAGAPKEHADNLGAEVTTVRKQRDAAARREAARQGRVDRATQRWAALAEDVTWFEPPQQRPPAPGELNTLRDANKDDEYSGTWYCPKLNRDVAYESRIERQVIQLLSFAQQVEYYQEQPLDISYQFAGKQYTYYPDLLVATTDGRCLLIEVKPVYEMAIAINIAKYWAMEEFCRERGWGLLTTDGARTRKHLENRSTDPRLEAALSTALTEHEELTWPQVHAAIGSIPLDSMDLAALILQHGWTWHTRPYRLRATGTTSSNRPPKPAAPQLNRSGIGGGSMR